MTFLAVTDLKKHFGGKKAVDGCSFTVEKGGITALIGPNGAGKTTAFNLISGLLKPDSGSISFNQERIDNLKPHKITGKGIRRTFQISRDLSEMTVLENLIVQSPSVRLLDLFKGSMSKQEKEHAMELLDFVNITHLANEKAGNLSFGQKKLMEFATALMKDPELILLDEPAGGINLTLLDKIVEYIQTINKKGITIFIVEHNMDLVMSLCETVIVMAYGKVLATGAPEEIQNNKAVLEAYLGVEE